MKSDSIIKNIIYDTSNNKTQKYKQQLNVIKIYPEVLKDYKLKIFDEKLVYLSDREFKDEEQSNKYINKPIDRVVLFKKYDDIYKDKIIFETKPKDVYDKFNLNKNYLFDKNFEADINNLKRDKEAFESKTNDNIIYVNNIVESKKRPQLRQIFKDKQTLNYKQNKNYSRPKANINEFVRPGKNIKSTIIEVNENEEISINKGNVSINVIPTNIDETKLYKYFNNLPFNNISTKRDIPNINYTVVLIEPYEFIQKIAFRNVWQHFQRLISARSLIDFNRLSNDYNANVIADCINMFKY